jgi:PAS domain S-box-containing protein
MSAVRQGPPSKPRVDVLLVDDDVVDRLACRRALTEHPQYDFKLIEAESGRQGLQSAHEHPPDCILLDYHLPDMSGLDFLQALADEEGEIALPVMMLTGSDSVGVAVEAMRRGVRDYLVKDLDGHYLDLLSAVLERMLREQHHIKAKQEAEARFRALVEQIPAITYTAAIGTPGQLLYVSPQLRTLGYAPEEWLAQTGALRGQIHADDRFRAIEAFDHARTSGRPLRCEYRLQARNGTYRWMRDEATVVHDSAGQRLFLQGVLFDITQEKLHEEELRRHQHRLEDLVAKRTTALSRANEQLRHELTTRNHRGQASFTESDSACTNGEAKDVG